MTFEIFIVELITIGSSKRNHVLEPHGIDSILIFEVFVTCFCTNLMYNHTNLKTMKEDFVGAIDENMWVNLVCLIITQMIYIQ